MSFQDKDSGQRRKGGATQSQAGPSKKKQSKKVEPSTKKQTRQTGVRSGVKSFGKGK